MFEKIIQWIKERLKMITPSSIKKYIGADVAINTPMQDALKLWALMYENQSPWLNRDVKSMGLAAAIAGEVSNMVTVEMEAEVSGSARADWLHEQLQPTIERLRDTMEYGEAKGGIIFKPYIMGGEIGVDYVQADMFYPIAFDGNGRITSAVFADQKQMGGAFYTRLEHHVFDNGNYSVTNSAFRSTHREDLGSPVSLESVPEWATLAPATEMSGIERPLFGYYRVPLSNTIDTKSPLGVSRYSRATDLIKQADEQWSRLLWEFESGERALYVDEQAFEKGENGRRQLPHRRLYRTLKTSGTIGNQELFEDWTPTLREQNILKGLDAILKRIEYACGLAYGTISDPNTIDRTATEIKLSKQRTYVTVTSAQKALITALDDLVYAMDVWATIGKLAPMGTYDTSYQFDDSVLTDKESEAQMYLQEVGAGIMSKVEYRMRRYGESEEIARERLALISPIEPMFAEE